MRLLLANGTKVSIESYTNTTAVVNGNSVPALSIVVNEPIDSAKDKFSNADALIDFNIYPDDKNVVLLHALGYEKRVSIAMGDDEKKCTVTLAKTTETDVLLNKVLSTLDSIEKKVQGHEETIGSIESSINEYSSAQNKATQKMNEMDHNVANVLNALEDVKLLLNNVNVHLRENDSLCEQVNTAVNGFSEISSQHISEMQSLRADVSSVSKSAAGAVKVADKAANVVSQQADALSRAVEASGEAKEAANSATTDMENLVKTMNDLSKQVGTVTKLATEIKDGAADANTVKELSKSLGIMRENVSSTLEKVTQVKKTITNITGVDIPNMDKKIDGVSKSASDLKQAQESIEKSVAAADKKANDAATDIKKVDERVSALEPVTDYTTLPIEEAKAYRVKESATALAEFLAANPITSTCHGGVEARYSITKDKQDYLQSMIAVTQLAEQSGVPYQPSWNATGEVCTYDWTLAELCQLAMEIETVVRPLVSYQQTIEKSINNCTTMEELQAVVINYNNAPVHESPVTTETTESSATDETAAEDQAVEE